MSALLAVAAALLLAPAADAAPAVVPRPLCCIPSGDVKAIAVDGNTAYVGGHFHHMGIPTHHLAVLDPSGGQPKDGWPRVDGGYLHASVGDGNGGWYVGGDFTSIGGEPRAHLAHLLSDGSVDPSWTPSVTGFDVAALARNGSVVYAGGNFTQVNGTGRANFAALNATTGALTGLQVDTDTMVRALATSSRPNLSGGTEDRLYIGGDFTTPRGHLAAVDLAAGTLLATDPKLNGSVYALGVGRLPSPFPTVNDPAIVYAGGDFTYADFTSSNLPRGHGVAYDDSLQLQNWDPGANSRINALGVGSTTIFLGGGFSVLHSDSRTRLGAVNATDGATQSWTATVDSFFAPDVRSLVLLGGNVYVGGRFTTANSEDRSDLAAFSAATGTLTSWDPDPPGLNRAIQHLGSDGTSLITSGEFEAIGGLERHNLAAVDLNTGQVTAFNPDVDDQVNALSFQNNTVYAVGKFTHASGTAVTRNHAAAFDPATGAPTAFDPDANGELYALAPAGETIFLGGVFNKLNAGVASRAGLAEVDSQTGAVTTFKQDDDGGLFAVAAGDGNVYAGGQFSHMGGVVREGFGSARFSPGSIGAMSPLDLGLDNGNSGFADVRSLLLRGSTLFLSGTFDEILGVPRHGFAAFDLTSNVLLPYDPHPDLFAISMAADDVNLFAAGQFTEFGLAPRKQLASVDLQTGIANDWSPTLPPETAVESVGLSRDGGILVGGATFKIDAAQGVLLAFALQPTTPAAPQASPGAGEASVSFNVPPDGGSPITQYKVTASPGGQTATGASSPITVGGLTPGTSYTFTVSATNAAGESPQSPASNAVTPTVPAGPAAPAAGGGSLRTPLSASKFRMTNKRFKVAKGKTALSARTKKGTTFLFQLSDAAVTRIAIQRKRPGRRKGKRCVAPRKRLKKKCTRYLKAGTLTRKKTKAGANKVRFTGRLGKRALKPGSYRATLVATAADGRKSKPLRLSFRVVRR